jgi:quinol monooxygenase YgiN
MVRLTIELRTSSPREAIDLLETLRFMTSATRLEHGCHECAAWTDREFTVHYSEGWATEADVRRRVRSAAFESLQALMECGAESPEITFDFVTKTRGLDYVEEIRGGLRGVAGGRYQ